MNSYDVTGYYVVKVTVHNMWADDEETALDNLCDYIPEVKAVKGSVAELDNASGDISSACYASVEDHGPAFGFDPREDNWREEDR